LAHVRVAHDDVESAEALGVRVRLVACVDDGPAPGGGARHALPDVLGPLADAVHGAAGGLQHLASAGIDLPADEEGNEHLGVMTEVVAPAGEVVLVAPVGVAGGVGVVLEQVDDAADALFAESLLGAREQALEDALPCLVVADEVVDGVALGRGVLGVTADIEVEAGTVLEEDVARPTPADDSAEEIAGPLVGAEPTLA